MIAGAREVSDNRTMSSNARPNPLLGCHLSIGRGFSAAVDAAEELGCSALQFFTHNASSWRMKPLTAERASEFIERRADASVEFVVAHTMYLINLASPDDALHVRSTEAMIEEVRRAALLGLDAVVTHLGAHVGSGRGRAIDRIVDALDRVDASGIFGERPGLRVLLENTAGSGTTMGSSFEELLEILERLENVGAFGLCFDTAHAFAAGYDLRTESSVDETLSALDRTVGLDRLGLIHLNDSKYALASRRDRHEHIGLGAIGREGLGVLARRAAARGVPIILETPKTIDEREDADRMNLAAVRALLKDRPDEQEGP